MDLKIRPPTDAEFAVYSAHIERAFGTPLTPERTEQYRPVSELDRHLAVFDGDDVVGAAGAFSFGLTLPGPVSGPVGGGAAGAGGAPHPRRGLLTPLMDPQLNDVAERGEAVAVLIASETGIYGRFGYGLGSFTSDVSIGTERSAFIVKPVAGGRLRVIATDEARAVVPSLFERWASSTVGSFPRSPAWWDVTFADHEHHRDGASGGFWVLHVDDAGEPDGFARWRTRATWTDGALPRNVVEVQDLCAHDLEVEAALWRFLLDLDLAAEVRFRHAPVDPAVRWRLVEPRRLVTTVVRDWLWVRLVDVAGALALRRYEVDGTLVPDVSDRFRPAQAGRYRLDVEGSAGTAARTDEPADLALDVADLGAAYLGGVRLRALADAGRVTELRAGALRQADATFATHPAPYCHTDF